MHGRRFAAWVRPIAVDVRASRAEVVAFARSQPPAAWDAPSRVPGWTRRDVLAHLAGDTGKVSAAVMRAAADPAAPAPSYGTGEDEVNAQDLALRRGRPIEALIAEIEEDGEEWQRLLARLSESDADRSWPGFWMDARGYLALVAPHDREHLAQMR